MKATSDPGQKTRSAADIDNSALLDLVQGYIRYYAAGQGHTARAKRNDLGHFIKFLTAYRGYSQAARLRVKDWDFSAIQRFIDESLAKGEAPATVNRRLATIKHMGRTLSERLAGFVNPARGIKAPQIRALCPKAIDSQRIEQIRQKALERRTRKPSFIRFRNEVLFNFLLDTGIRADEVRLLKRSQVDAKLEWLAGVRTKGRRFRNVYITSAMRVQLSEYLEARERELKRFFPKLPHSIDQALPLFISTYGARANDPGSFLMGAKTLWRAINDLSVDEKLHPHLLRHSYALDLLDESNDIRMVSQALGHSDVRVTMRYTERQDKEVAKALERARNRRRKA